MDFALTDDHLALRGAVRRFCEGEHPAHERGNAETPELAAHRHEGLAALGVLGLTLDEALGGGGQGPVEVMITAQELARVLAAAPFIPNAVLAAPLLAAAGTLAQRQRWLPALARGECRFALACHEEGARQPMSHVTTRAQRTVTGWRLDGRKALVLGGDVAHELLVVARTTGRDDEREGLSLFAVNANTPGLVRRSFHTLDARGAAHLELDGVSVEPDRLVGPQDGAWPLIEEAFARANAALCAESAGALEALLELTCEHLKTRRQFGAPLAKFQALQHALADMAIALEQLRSMACVAAMALQDDAAAQRERLVSAAKTLAAQLGRRCALSAIQLHGAMGMTDECRVGHYAKRLIANGLLFGDARHHLQRVAAS